MLTSFRSAVTAWALIGMKQVFASFRLQANLESLDFNLSLLVGLVSEDWQWIAHLYRQSASCGTNLKPQLGFDIFPVDEKNAMEILQ